MDHWSPAHKVFFFPQLPVYLRRNLGYPLCPCALFVCLSCFVYLIPVHISAGVHVNCIIFHISNLLWLGTERYSASCLNISKSNSFFGKFLTALVKKGNFDVDRRCTGRGV